MKTLILLAMISGCATSTTTEIDVGSTAAASTVAAMVDLGYAMDQISSCNVVDQSIYCCAFDDDGGRRCL